MLGEPFRTDDRSGCANAGPSLTQPGIWTKVYLKIDGRMVYLWRPEQHDPPDPGCDGALHGGVGLRSCCRRGVKQWSLTSWRKLVKIGAKVVRHGCYVIFQMAEVAVSKEFPGNLAADRRTATKTGSSVGTEGVGCVITTGGVCLNDEEKHQIGFSGMVRGAATPEARADSDEVARV